MTMLKPIGKWPWTVSYTHLDVYKRQLLLRGGVWAIVAATAFQPDFTLSLLAKFITSPWAGYLKPGFVADAIGYAPVSYTHLITKQRNFSHIKYNWPGGSGKTVKSSGCGPCAMLMVIENMLAKPWLMADWIKWVLSTGARVNGGTDMRKLCQAVVKKYGLEFTTTSSEANLIEHIKKGGMAIANVGGKRSGWAGLFSDSGHFVTVLGLLQDGRFIIGDPGIYSGKFNSSFRRSKVQVDGDLVYVNAANLHQDTLNRSPNYYLLKQAAELTKPTEPIEEEEKMYKTIDDVPKDLYPAVKRRIDCGALKGDGKGNINVTESMACLLYTSHLPT